MGSCFKTIILLSAVLLSLNPLSAQDPVTTLSIQGDVQKPVQWTIEQLKEQFADQIQDIKFGGGQNSSEKTGTGIPLLSAIKAAEPKVEKETKWTLKDKLHYSMVFLVTVEAGDSYKVFFSLPELMPEFGNVQAWLLWSVDGKQLTGKEAPLRLVVSTDKWPDRNIYGIVKIALMDCNTLPD